MSSTWSSTSADAAGEIDAAKANLLASDLAFNDTHRRVIYQVASAYYRLLNAEGQRQAAEISLENAKTVEEDAKARLANGLATKPDELEATAARSPGRLRSAGRRRSGRHRSRRPCHSDWTRARHGIQSPGHRRAEAALRHRRLRRSGNRSGPQPAPRLAPAIGACARCRCFDQAGTIHLFSFSQLDGRWRSGAGLRTAGSFPRTLCTRRSVERRNLTSNGPSSTARDANTVSPRLRPTKRPRKPRSMRFATRLRTRCGPLTPNMQTALRQQQAAAALLTASQQSYEAAHEAYGYGVRNLLDVVSAQKALAQARSEDIAARTQLLLQVTNLAFRTGDLIQTQHWSPGP